MKIVADLHCHTMASTHGYNTITEMIEGAKRAGVKAIAITDHGPQMPDAPFLWHFENFCQIPEYVEDILVLPGAEANIIDYTGEIDIPDYLAKELKIIVASVHNPVLVPKDFDAHTTCMMNVAKNPNVDIIGHCGTANFTFDYEKVIKEVRDEGKFIEINGNTFEIRKTSIENCKEIARLCKALKCPIVVNSDAHSMYKVGEAGKAFSMLEEMEFPEELIMNIDYDRFIHYLNTRKRRV